jgi:hypothetical protein
MKRQQAGIFKIPPKRAGTTKDNWRHFLDLEQGKPPWASRKNNQQGPKRRQNWKKAPTKKARSEDKYSEESKEREKGLSVNLEAMDTPLRGKRSSCTTTAKNELKTAKIASNVASTKKKKGKKATFVAGTTKDNWRHFLDLEQGKPPWASRKNNQQGPKRRQNWKKAPTKKARSEDKYSEESKEREKGLSVNLEAMDTPLRGKRSLCITTAKNELKTAKIASNVASTKKKKGKKATFVEVALAPSAPKAIKKQGF